MRKLTRGIAVSALSVAIAAGSSVATSAPAEAAICKGVPITSDIGVGVCYAVCVAGVLVIVYFEAGAGSQAIPVSAGGCI